MMREEKAKLLQASSFQKHKEQVTTEYLGAKINKSSSNTSASDTKTPYISSEIEILLQQTPQQILQNIQRDVNCLTSTEKGKRIGAMKKLKSLFDAMESRKDSLPIVDYMKFFFSHIYQPLLKLFSNETEYCRETSVKLIATFISYASRSEIEESLPFMIPILEERMKGPKEKFNEESEEVRVSLVKLMKLLIEKCTSIFEDADYLQAAIHFLEKAFEDFHAVKIEACGCVVSLCLSLKETTIKLFSGSLIKKLVPHLKHQRFNVRSDVLEAIKHLVSCGSVEVLEELHSPLRELCLDRSSAVRQKLLDVVIDWTLNLRDKYSFQHNFVYYLVLLSSDEIDTISKSAFDYILEAGRQFENDHEDEVNETRMYDEDENNQIKSTVYEDVERLPKLPPVIIQRPLLGSRLLVGKKHLTKVINYLITDFEDWSLQRRIEAAKALQLCVIFAERNLTQHLDKLMVTLFQACNDDEKDLREESLRVVSLIGYFLEPETYLNIIYNNSRPEYAASPKFLSTVLKCLSLLVSHSHSMLVSKILPTLLNKLGSQHLVYSEEPNVKLNILHILDACLCNKSVTTLEIGFEVFILVLKVCSQPNTPEVISKSGLSLMDQEAKLFGLNNVEEFYNIYYEKAFTIFTSDVASWDKLSPNFYSFEALLRNSPKSTIIHFSKIFEVLGIHLATDKDPMMILRLLSALNSIIYSSGKELSQEHIHYILTHFIYPHSKWRNGRVYVDVRKAAISCFSCIVRQQLCTTKETIQTFCSESQFDNFMSCMDDDFDPHLRGLVVKIMIDLIEYSHDLLTEKQWDTLCTELRNRMEDENDDVRAITSTTIGQLLLYLPAQMVDQCTALVFCLSTHMDDPNPEIRKSCFNTFQTVISDFKNHQHLEYVKERLDTINHQIRGFLQSSVRAKNDSLPYQNLI
ncbi:predicted protein [Naegleria gruberi]|uniref:Predicted protein n=1 Tax=Naegleria gruberi TaxID=5762 RepID=D2UY28_NAEGR|nr:uncharacterized protein NAEGRDRAFT_56483 [Naegleria gruberi]EFC50399.1 predicted protein [Naegleria gruberi]|eukprot:XP_002683143.1 predicted protein [Naegleria gruberi strain NEG-M]